MDTSYYMINIYEIYKRVLLSIVHCFVIIFQGLTFFLSYAILAAMLGMLQFGYNTGVINAPELNIENFMKDVYKDRYGEDMQDEAVKRLYSLAVSIFAIGGMLGGFSGGMVANRFGRLLFTLYFKQYLKLIIY